MSQPYSFGPPEDEPDSDPPPTAAPEPTPVVEPEPEPAAPEPEPQAAVDGVDSRYVFTYGYPTTYPELGLTFEPGDLYDWPDGPPTDGRWTPATPKE